MSVRPTSKLHGETLTSAIATHAIDRRIIADLEQTSIAAPARAIMATMPATANSVTFFPTRDTWPDSNDAANDLVTWDQILL